MTPKQHLRELIDRLRTQVYARLPAVSYGAPERVEPDQLRLLADLIAGLAAVERDYAAIPDEPAPT